LYIELSFKLNPFYAPIISHIMTLTIELRNVVKLTRFIDVEINKISYSIV